MFWSATPNFGQRYYLWSATLVLAGQLVAADQQNQCVLVSFVNFSIWIDIVFEIYFVNDYLIRTLEK
jgi:hypothetical protein